MKKTYTKKQITEAIAYWKKQLKLGNYKTLNESDGDLCRSMEFVFQDLISTHQVKAFGGGACEGSVYLYYHSRGEALQNATEDIKTFRDRLEELGYDVVSEDIAVKAVESRFDDLSKYYPDKDQTVSIYLTDLIEDPYDEDKYFTAPDGFKDEYGDFDLMKYQDHSHKIRSFKLPKEIKAAIAFIRNGGSAAYQYGFSYRGAKANPMPAQQAIKELQTVITGGVNPCCKWSFNGRFYGLRYEKINGKKTLLFNELGTNDMF